jgi:hypothetical protein
VRGGFFREKFKILLKYALIRRGDMKKKAKNKKIAAKSTKKEIKKKLKTTLQTARETITKKKEQKRFAPIEKKTATKKVKAKIKEKPKKVAKKIVAKIEEKPKKVIKKFIAEIEKKPKKVARKVIAKIEKKVPIKAIKKVEVKKEEVKAKIKEKPEKVVAKVIEKPERIVARIIEKPEKVVKKVEVKVKEKPEKIVKKIEAKVELKKPLIEEKYPLTPWETLPAEYGEDSIVLMTVDPNKLFTYWEAREDTLAMHEGNLNIRVYDVTGVEFDGTNANSYFDIAVSEKIGSRYIDVSPGKEFITDIGIINIEGIFITIARSNKVLNPRITISEEVVLPQKLYETGLRVGY